MKNKLSLEMVQSRRNSKLCKMLEDSGIDYNFVFVGDDPYNPGHIAVYHPYGGGPSYKGFKDVEWYIKKLIKNKN